MTRSIMFGCAGLIALVIFTESASASVVAGTGTYKHTVLYSFTGSPDGFWPGNSPFPVHPNGKLMLYGTTCCGGAKKGGTVYSLDPSNSAETVVHSFPLNSSPGGFINVNGKLFGTTHSGGAYGGGTVFSFDWMTKKIKSYSFCSDANCTAGTNPGGLSEEKDGLYGEGEFGGGTGCTLGGTGCGTVFSFDPNTGAAKLRYAFQGGSDGETPGGGVVEVAGMLYGATFGGGSLSCNGGTGCGTAFSLDPSTGAETVLYPFCSKTNCTDGSFPSNLINVGGTWYGTTFQGGNGTTCACGTIFALTNSGGTWSENVLHNFGSTATDGEDPEAGLTNVKGTLYGTTVYGGGTGCGGIGCGTVFAFNPSTGTVKVIYAFQGGSDGASPLSNPIAVNGNFYGTTQQGGADNVGTVYVLEKTQ